MNCGDGSAIAAFIQVGVPQDIILSLGQGTVSSVVVMMILAVMVPVCSNAVLYLFLVAAQLTFLGSLFINLHIN